MLCSQPANYLPNGWFDVVRKRNCQHAKQTATDLIHMQLSQQKRVVLSEVYSCHVQFQEEEKKSSFDKVHDTWLYVT